MLFLPIEVRLCVDMLLGLSELAARFLTDFVSISFVFCLLSLVQTAGKAAM
jgi:hypothetical protein